MPEAYIVAAARTAGGRRNGRLSGWHPADLAAQVLNALIARTDVDPALVEDVIMGCVGQVGEQASNIARNAVLASRLPESVPATSVDRQCGSSQQALHFAAQAVMSGSMDIVIAAGVESMTRVPMGTPNTLPLKNGLGFYVSPLMQQRYPDVQFSQFTGAEMIARNYGIEKMELDTYALRSHRNAIAATQAGLFDQEIVPVAARMGDGTEPGDMHTTDEGIRYDATLESIAGVKLIAEGGRCTAATASQICDGASGVMVVNERGLKVLGVKPLARVHHMSVIGHDPVIMLEAPIPATQRALKKAGMKIGDIDLYEVNEAFAPVPLAWLQTLDADPTRLNVNGGAIALGHPIACTGVRIVATLVHEMHKRDVRYGLATLCVSGGQGLALALEKV